MMAMGFKETEREWAERAKRFVKAELKRADVTYEELAARLRELGLEETKVSIASKLSRGGFGAAFFLATMKAIGREQVNLDSL
jgi:3-mercaptopyruvate sulfurtransferase SseA